MKQLHTHEIRLPAPLTEFSFPFVQGMANRMAVSYHKYGAVADGYPAKVSAIDSLQQRIDKYIETGNAEHLIDLANFAMIEFMHPAHENAHFKPTDSSGSLGRVSNSGEVTFDGNKELV